MLACQRSQSWLLCTVQRAPARVVIPAGLQLKARVERRSYHKPQLSSTLISRISARPQSGAMASMEGVSRVQSREHAGHAHHHHDNTYLTSANKNDAGVRITRIGLWVNLGMAIGKGVGGYAFNSQGALGNQPLLDTDFDHAHPLIDSSICRRRAQPYRSCIRLHDPRDCFIGPEEAV